MGGMVSGAASLLGIGSSAKNLVDGSKGGGGGGGGGNQVTVQAAQPTLCGQASVLTDNHSTNSNNMEPVVQGNLGSSFGAIPAQQNTGMLPTTYADGGDVLSSSNNESPSLKDTIGKYQKMFCIEGAMPKWACDKPEMLHYQHIGNSPQGGLTTIHQGGFGNGFADGGDIKKYKEAAPEGHHPEFITGKTGYYASGEGTGQSDDIPAMLHDGDYVMDADVVSALGDGSSKAGREVLDGFRQRIPHQSEGGDVKPVPAKIADGEYVFPAAFVTALGSGDNKRGSEILDGLRTKLRQHKRGAPDSKIPPKAKDPIDYIKKGSK